MELVDVNKWMLFWWFLLYILLDMCLVISIVYAMMWNLISVWKRVIDLHFFYFRWYSIEILFSDLLWYSIEILFFVIFYLCTLILLFLFDNIHYFLWMYFFLFVLGYGCLVSLSYLHVEVFIGLTCCIIFKLYYVVLLFVNHVCIYFMICVINGWIL